MTIQDAEQAKNIVNLVNQTAIVSMTDELGRINMANPKFCEISGYSEQELIGKNHRIVNSGVHPKEFFTKMWDRIQSGQVWNGEICNRRKDGTYYWVDCMIAPLGTPQKKSGFLSIRYDISERKRLESKLISASNLNTANNVAAGLCHEIINPLTIIIGKSRQLRRLISSASESETANQIIDRIDLAAQRINAVVKGLISFTTQEKSTPKITTTPAAIIEKTCNLCKTKIERSGVRIEISEIPEASLFVREEQIVKALFHVIENAFEAALESSDRWIRINLQQLGSRFMILVTDSGQGIPSSIKNKFMLPFFTTKPVGEPGLGLSIAQGLMGVNEGSLEINSQSANTCFVLSLPLNSAKQ